MLLLHKKLSKKHKLMILLLDMKNKLQILSKKMLHQELQELNKQEVELKAQEIQEDGELFGHLDH